MQTDHTPASYDYEALDMKQFPLPTGAIVRKFARVFEGKIPRRIIVAFFKQTAFSGQRDETPLLTAGIDLRQISLSLNGVVVRELSTNYDNDIYLEAYRRFTDWMQTSESEYFISFEIFKRGYRYYCFDLMESCPNADACAEEMLRQGFLDIQLQLGGALGSEHVMTVFFEAPESVEITKERAARHIRTIA
jgi:hypothetical protein